MWLGNFFTGKSGYSRTREESNRPDPYPRVRVGSCIPASTGIPADPYSVRRIVKSEIYGVTYLCISCNAVSIYGKFLYINVRKFVRWSHIFLPNKAQSGSNMALVYDTQVLREHTVIHKINTPALRATMSMLCNSSPHASELRKCHCRSPRWISAEYREI